MLLLALNGQIGSSHTINEFIPNYEVALEESCFKEMPDDIYYIIFCFLSAQDVVYCGLVCKYWKTLHRDNYVWSLLYKKKFPWDKNIISHYYLSYCNRMEKKLEVAMERYEQLEEVLKSEHMKYLINLEIKDHRVINIPPAISMLSIQNLSVIYTQISTFPTVLTSLENLRELNMGYNKLKKIPPDIAQLKNLTKLQLNNNKLTNIPTEIGSLEKLIELDIFKNKLTSLPSQIGNLTRLETLSVQCNALKFIPEELSQCKHLRMGNFSHNQIEEVPKDLATLTNLQKLLFSKNKIKRIPESLLDMTSLLELNFFDNPIEEYPKNADKLGNVIIFDLK